MFQNPKHFPIIAFSYCNACGFAGVGHHNFCRNPSRQKSNSFIWCYTADDYGWDYCDPLPERELALPSKQQLASVSRAHAPPVVSVTQRDFEKLREKAGSRYTKDNARVVSLRAADDDKSWCSPGEKELADEDVASTYTKLIN